MARRIYLSVAWFFAAWMIAAMAAFVLALPGFVAPVAAVWTAVLVMRPTLGDWRGAPADGRSGVAVDR